MHMPNVVIKFIHDLNDCILFNCKSCSIAKQKLILIDLFNVDLVLF